MRLGCARRAPLASLPPPVKCSVLPRRGLRRPEVSVRTDSAAAALQPLWGCVSERDIAPHFAFLRPRKQVREGSGPRLPHSDARREEME